MAPTAERLVAQNPDPPPVSELPERPREQDPEVDPERDADDPVADVVIHVIEGDRYTVGRIDFEGNTLTRDEVLRRELRLQEGSVMSLGALRQSIVKINQLGYFQLDAEEPVILDVDGDAKKVHLTFRGQEADRTEVQLGGGWNDNYGLEGQLSVRTQNFLGRGETLAVQLARGEIRDAVDLSYVVPWFLGRPQSVGLRLFDEALSYEVDDLGYDLESRGARLSFGRSVGLFQSLSLAYSLLDQDQVFDTRVFDETTRQDEIVPMTLRQTSASLRPSWVFDSRDSRFEPTRGRRLAASLELADEVLGGDTELLRPEVQLSLFRPLGRGPVRTVLAFNVEAGAVEALGDTVLTPSQRYRLGGASSIRGHRSQTIFVRDDEDRRLLDPFGFPLGGDRLLRLNLEVHALLDGPLRVLGFLDAGNVWDSGVGVDVTDLRATAGLELRLSVPLLGAPLRLIYATNLDPIPEVRDPATGLVTVPGDDFQGFQFHMGTSF